MIVLDQFRLADGDEECEQLLERLDFLYEQMTELDREAVEAGRLPAAMVEAVKQGETLVAVMVWETGDRDTGVVSPPRVPIMAVA